MAAKTLNSLT